MDCKILLWLGMQKMKTVTVRKNFFNMKEVFKNITDPVTEAWYK